ncbi:two-partner secretion domain-containing protein [Prosthecochloris vibrioformis]|nr:GLUG motif-containing protein [Prosthecochloris vibrioformis]
MNRILSFALAGVSAFCVVTARADALDPAELPSGATISRGSGSIETSGSTMTVRQNSENMIAEWNSFNIGSSASVEFVQPGSEATALNRIHSVSPTRIQGQLSSNGRVFLLNSSGIVIGQDAQVNVGGLLATSLEMTDDDFLDGHYRLVGHAHGGDIVNDGTIRVPEGGVIALVAPVVDNRGYIDARKGEVILASAGSVLLRFGGDDGISYEIDAGAVDAVTGNSGVISATGGIVVMTAEAANDLSGAAVNNSGIIEARTVSGKEGRIVLLADMQSGTTLVSGTLDASAPDGGDGGFIETSGAKVEIADGTGITTRSETGQTGMWLIDPDDYTIAETGGDITGQELSDNLTVTNVTIQTAEGTGGHGDIFVNDEVEWEQHTLRLEADRNIEINRVMTASADSRLEMTTGTDGTVTCGLDADGFHGRVDFPDRTGTGFLRIDGNEYTVIDNPASVQDISSDLDGYYALGAHIDASPTAAWNDGAGFAPIGSPETETYFTGTIDGLGHDISELAISRPDRDNLGLFAVNEGHISNIGLEGGAVSGDGYSVGSLTGINDGTITNSFSTVSVQGYGDVGGLVGGNNGMVSGSYAAGTVTGLNSVGGLVGANYATIDNSFATGPVTGQSTVGGLVGMNDDALTDSYATGTVTGHYVVGGLAGYNWSTITRSYAIGAIEGYSDVGGLAGVNDAVIDQSYATGEVSGHESVGGLVGCLCSDAEIRQAFAEGDVSGGLDVGGLVGYSYFGTIENSYARGAVTGLSSDQIAYPDLGDVVDALMGGFGEIDPGDSEIILSSAVGGLVGMNDAGSIEYSYATGPVQGNEFVGGLVGKQSGGSVSRSFWDSETTGQATSAGAGTGVSTSDMQSLGTYLHEDAGWNISEDETEVSTWMITDGYPFLRNVSEWVPLEVPEPPGTEEPGNAADVVEERSNRIEIPVYENSNERQELWADNREDTPGDLIITEENSAGDRAMPGHRGDIRVVPEPQDQQVRTALSELSPSEPIPGRKAQAAAVAADGETDPHRSKRNDGPVDSGEQMAANGNFRNDSGSKSFADHVRALFGGLFQGYGDFPLGNIVVGGSSILLILGGAKLLVQYAAGAKGLPQIGRLARNLAGGASSTLALFKKDPEVSVSQQLDDGQQQFEPDDVEFDPEGFSLELRLDMGVQEFAADE